KYLDRSESHCHRTGDAVLSLVPEIVQRGARDPCTLPAFGPREGMQSGAECELHQLVVCRVILDYIDTVPETIVGPQLWRMAIGLGGKDLYALAAYKVSHFPRARSDPSSAFARDRCLQSSVTRPGVKPYERWWLVARFGGDFHAGGSHASYCHEVGVERDKIACHGRKKVNDMDETTKEVATLAGGCFWCLEAVFDDLRGVESVESGYMGGRTPTPPYELVCSGETGHAEVVRVTYDPKAVS